MFAKFYFSSSWSISEVRYCILAALTGQTDLSAINTKIPTIPSMGSSHLVPALSYILNSKTAGGWTAVTAIDASGGNGSSVVLSAPCLSSSKLKYVNFVSNATELVVGMSQASNMSSPTGATTRTSLLRAGTTYASGGSCRHRTDQPLEVWVSSSARHFLVAANRPGYGHGQGLGTDSTTPGYVGGVFEHMVSDAWMVDGVNHLPAVLLAPGDNMTASSPTGPTIEIVGLATGGRDITQPIVTDTYSGLTGISARGLYTKYGSGTQLDVTLGGTCILQQDENTQVRALMPFGFRNKTSQIRGGAVSDVCNVYLAPGNTFAPNTILQVGTDNTNLFNIWKFYEGVDLAVPRG